jgi:hypothetical protein
MVDPGLLRFLELVRREVGAADARIELGGRDPEDPRIVFHSVENGWRVVALFETPPENPGGLAERLGTLTESFLATTTHAVGGPISPRVVPDLVGRRLDDELARLSERAQASGAVVFDLSSPVVWGASRRDPDGARQFEDAIARLREESSTLRSGQTARLTVKDGLECVARTFAGVYVVSLVFDGPVSEPVAVGALLHALPLIERLVLALPPVDPSPGGAKVIRIPRRPR